MLTQIVISLRKLLIMETLLEEKVFTGYRLRKKTIARLKVLAHSLGISVNELVDNTLSELTANVKTEEDIREEKEKLDKFLALCSNAWAGEGFDNCEKAINNCRTINPIIEL